MLITQAELEELLQVNNGYRQNIIWEDDNSCSIEVFSPRINQLTLATRNILTQLSSKCMFMDGPCKGDIFKRLLHKTVRGKTLYLLSNDIVNVKWNLAKKYRQINMN